MLWKGGLYLPLIQFREQLAYLFWLLYCWGHMLSHRRTGPVLFRGAEVSCPNMLSIACPKIKWFCPNITWFFFFCPNMAIWKILGGGGGAAAPQSPRPHLVRLCALIQYYTAFPFYIESNLRKKMLFIPRKVFCFYILYIILLWFSFHKVQFDLYAKPLNNKHILNNNFFLSFS